MLFRAANPADAGELTELAISAKRHWGYAEALLELWIPELTFTSESIVAREVLVADEGGQILGVAAVTKDAHQPELEELWIRPGWMGKGIGRNLLGRIWNPVFEAGASRLIVVSDPNAVGFYLRLGARRIGWHPSKPVGRFLPKLELTKRVILDPTSA